MSLSLELALESSQFNYTSFNYGAPLAFCTSTCDLNLSKTPIWMIILNALLRALAILLEVVDDKWRQPF